MAIHYCSGAGLRRRRAERGFSLIELVIALAVVGVSISIAMPMFRSVIRNTAVSNNTNDLVTSLASARSEAVRRGMQVGVIANSGSADWSTGWQVIADTNRDGVFTAADEVVSASPALANQYRVYARNAGAGGDARVVFNLNGSLVTAGFDMNVCFPTGDRTKSRRIRVRASGNVSAHRDTTGSTATACPAGT